MLDDNIDMLDDNIPSSLGNILVSIGVVLTSSLQLCFLFLLLLLFFVEAVILMVIPISSVMLCFLPATGGRWAGVSVVVEAEPPPWQPAAAPQLAGVASETPRSSARPSSMNRLFEPLASRLAFPIMHRFILSLIEPLPGGDEMSWANWHRRPPPFLSTPLERPTPPLAADMHGEACR